MGPGRRQKRKVLVDKFLEMLGARHRPGANRRDSDANHELDMKKKAPRLMPWPRALDAFASYKDRDSRVSPVAFRSSGGSIYIRATAVGDLKLKGPVLHAGFFRSLEMPRGFRPVVNIRPDESPGQFPNAQAEAAAHRHGLEFRHQRRVSSSGLYGFRRAICRRPTAQPLPSLLIGGATNIRLGWSRLDQRRQEMIDPHNLEGRCHVGS